MSVARHYDALDDVYFQVWGEHVHHGLWRRGDETRAEATRALADLVLARAELPPRPLVADVGCGYGGTSRILASELDAEVTGLTLSGAQAARARAGAPRGMTVLVRDWLENGLDSDCFDAVVAIESLSHMPDLRRAVAEAARVLKPGGRFVLVDWIRGDSPSAWERRLLVRPIEREGHLPGLQPVAAYEEAARGAGLRPVGFEDLSRPARRTWSIARRRLLRLLLTNAGARSYLLSPDNPERAFAFSLARIPLAYRTGAMRLGLLWAVKPG